MDAQAREHACPQAVALLMAASAIAVTAAARGLTSPAEGPVGSSEPAPTRVAASLQSRRSMILPRPALSPGTHRAVGCGARCTRSYGVTAL